MSKLSGVATGFQILATIGFLWDMCRVQAFQYGDVYSLIHTIATWMFWIVLIQLIKTYFK